MNWTHAVLVFLLAAIARFPGIADRPMHADEAVNAARLDNPEYTPQDFHGPVLQYATWLTGTTTWTSATETRLRLVPALTGCLVAAALTAVHLHAGILAAVSPAMIFYSRDYVPEMLLVLFTAGLLLTRQAAFAGAAFATKETAIIAIVADPRLKRPILGLLAAALLLGPLDLLQAVQGLATVWLPRAIDSPHTHGPLFYIERLASTEWPLLLLALAGIKQNRRIAIWTAITLVIYSAIPYKTPWCALTPLLGFIWLAGHADRRLVLAAAIVLALRDPQPTWSYSETYPAVTRLQLPPDTAIDVISNQNLWPLPWYLRRNPNVKYSTAVPTHRPIAPIVIITADQEPALTRALYELPPPGQRPLYTPLFSIDLRPGLQLRGYSSRLP